MTKLKMLLTPEEHAARKAAKRAAWQGLGPALIERPLRAAQKTLGAEFAREKPGAEHLLRVAVGTHHLVKAGDGTAAKNLARDAEKLTMSLAEHLNSNYIEFTGHEPYLILQKAYELSSPQGMGFMHARAGGLSDDEAKAIVAGATRGSPPHNASISFDYVHGRAMKLWMDVREGRLFLPRSWYDHSEEAMRALCESFSIDYDSVPDQPKEGEA